jgi:mRNA interferase MazF
MVIVQDDRFDDTDSVTVCAFTTDSTEAPLIRLSVQADDTNGLHRDSSLMVDKVLTVPRSQHGSTRPNDARLPRTRRRVGIAASTSAYSWAYFSTYPSLFTSCHSRAILGPTTQLPRRQIAMNARSFERSNHALTASVAASKRPCRFDPGRPL